MRTFGLIILLFITSLAYAQQVEFKASAPSVVATGEQFRLSYTVNQEGTDLQVPTLEGFDLLMGPAMSQSSSFRWLMEKPLKVNLTLILMFWKACGRELFRFPGLQLR